jgi:hypothetical protein
MQMHQVYSNAMLNIAASCARNSESGCFMHRVPGFGKPVPYETGARAGGCDSGLESEVMKHHSKSRAMHACLMLWTTPLVAEAGSMGALSPERRDQSGENAP